MGVEIPGAAPSGSLHVVLMAIGLVDDSPIVDVIAMLVAKAPSPKDALHDFMVVCIGVVSAHVL